MNLWKWIIEHVFPGTYDEYLEANKIHLTEVKKYRTNPQFVIGLLLFFVPALVLLLESGWRGKIIAVCLVVGEVLIRDTITEHYSALVNRERKQLPARSSSP